MASPAPPAYQAHQVTFLDIITFDDLENVIKGKPIDFGDGILCATKQDPSSKCMVCNTGYNGYLKNSLCPGCITSVKIIDRQVYLHYWKKKMKKNV